jgi:exonuclease VII large subunit
MNTRVEDGVVQVLRTALKKIDEEREALNRIAEEKRREFDEYVTRQHEALDRRQQALGTALQAMILDEETLSNHEDGNGPRLAISDANLNVIRDYLDAHDGEVRQQDVVNDTGLNSGVVSRYGRSASRSWPAAQVRSSRSSPGSASQPRSGSSYTGAGRRWARRPAHGACR